MRERPPRVLGRLTAVVAGGALLMLAAVGAAKSRTTAPHERVAIANMFELCIGQEALGQPGSCWNLFLQKYGATAELARVAYAKGLHRRVEFKRRRTCGDQQRWDGKACVDRCPPHEAWDLNRRLCMAEVERGCLSGHEANAEGRCVKVGCPAGRTRAPDGQCVFEAKFQSGMPVLVTRNVGNVLRQGDAGTVYGFHADSGDAFVILRRTIGANVLEHGYPEDGDVPQGRESHATWIPQELLRTDYEAQKQIVPTWCKQAAGSVTHGAVKVGTWVILGRHRRVQGEDNWAPSMEEYVGTRTQVKELRTETDAQGCPYVRVLADEGKWNWRLRDLQLAPTPQAGGPVDAE